MNEYFCENCSCKLTGEEEFCPECEIQLIQFETSAEHCFICPICQSNNLAGEKKCCHCCSII